MSNKIKNKTKKTFELTEEVVDTIKNISEFFEVNEVEIIEIAVNKPKIYMTLIKIYENFSGVKNE